MKGVDGWRGLKPRDPGRRDTPGEKVLKERRAPRRRGRNIWDQCEMVERAFCTSAISSRKSGDSGFGRWSCGCQFLSVGFRSLRSCARGGGGGF